MKIDCNGQRLSTARSGDLIRSLGYGPLAVQLAAEGYHLAPVRAPSARNRGRIAFRLTWTKRAGDEVLTIRVTHAFNRTL